MDRLDRVAAECMGWTIGPVWTSHPNKPRGTYETKCGLPMRPTRSWEDFGDLLLWAAGKGLSPRIWTDRVKWYAEVVGGTVFVTTDPRVALSLAVAEWAKGKEKP